MLIKKCLTNQSNFDWQYTVYRLYSERKMRMRRRIVIEDIWALTFINTYYSVGNDVEFMDIIAFQVELYSNHVIHLIMLLHYDNNCN